MVRDMYGEAGETDAVSPATVSNYVALLESLYLVMPVRGWEPPARSPKRFRTSPKRYLVDPSLAVALLQMNERSLKEDWQTLGLVFENLCVRDLTVYARALPEASQDPMHYYRDDNGLEADAVIEDASGRWGAFEVKLGENQADEAAQNLRRIGVPGGPGRSRRALLPEGGWRLRHPRRLPRQVAAAPTPAPLRLVPFRGAPAW